MRAFISDLKGSWSHRPFVWTEYQAFSSGKVSPPRSGRVLVLAPHPDDPESVAVTCRLLMRSGCEIWYAIASLSPSGVEDGYGQGGEEERAVSSQEWKRETRRREQVQAAASFGLGPGRLAFLNIEEEGRLHPGGNSAKIRGHLEAVAPDMVIMPVGRDQNRTHAWVHRVFRDCAQDLADRLAKPFVALYNEDPKTVEIRSDLFVVFGEESAAWKGALLRAHDSQQQRNVRTRGLGLDERILRMNQLRWQRMLSSPAHAPPSERYAEAFEIETFAPSVSG